VCPACRTLIRSFERELFVIPNAVFSKNTVLNVTRKMREWRFYEFLCVRVQDVHKVNAVIQVGSQGGSMLAVPVLDTC
jgi:MscS family membrane protein